MEEESLRGEEWKGEGWKRGGGGGRRGGRRGGGGRGGRRASCRMDERGGRRQGEGNTPESLGSARYASQRGGRQETCSCS